MDCAAMTAHREAHFHQPPGRQIAAVALGAAAAPGGAGYSLARKIVIQRPSQDSMLPANKVSAIARGRLKDAQVLLDAGRYDGAFYLCGYSVEIALKARICRTLRWRGFPESPAEFKGRQAVRTHDLEVLLAFSGVEAIVLTGRMPEWSAVLEWNPEKRYIPIGHTTKQQAEDLMASARRLLEVL